MHKAKNRLYVQSKLSAHSIQTSAPVRHTQTVYNPQYTNIKNHNTSQMLSDNFINHLMANDKFIIVISTTPNKPLKEK